MSLRLSELKKTGVYTPELTVGNAATSLRKYLSDEKAQPQRSGKRTLLIPYNKSGAHWFALVIKINSLNEIDKIIYIDSLQENEEYFHNLCEEIKIVYGNFSLDKVGTQKRLKQRDFTSCGPLTIENLIEFATNEEKPLELEIWPDYNRDIRRGHVRIYHPYDPSFYQRQRTNTNRVASVFQQKIWLKKAGDNFRERELLRISKLINLIKRMPELKKELVATFARQSSEENKDHLDRLRRDLLVLFKKNVKNEFFIELLRTLFNLTDIDLSELADLGNYRFQLDYEELSQVCSQIDNKAINNDLEKDLENQLKKDEELAKKIQAELWKDIESSDEEKESKKDLGDPFLWQIHAYYEAVFEKIEKLTSQNFNHILEQLITQIKKINKDKLIPKSKAVREEIRDTLIGHFEATLSYLFKNPQIGTSELLDDMYVYTNTHHFGKWLSEYSGLSLDLDGIRNHLDTELKAYSYRWKKDLLWQLHMASHINGITAAMQREIPIKITERIPRIYLGILFNYEKIKNVIIQIDQLEVKASEEKKKNR